MPGRTLNKTIGSSTVLTVFPLVGEGEGVVLQGEQAALKYEYCLKPGVDRVYLSGWGPLSYETFFTDGFALNVKQSSGQMMNFDIESFSYTKEKGIGKINVIGKRQFETFLDKPFAFTIIETSLEKAIISILDGYKVSLNIPNKKDVKVAITPHPSKTRREIVGSLCEQHGLMWCASLYNDTEVFVFESELSSPDIEKFPIEFNSASLIFSPIGFFSGEQLSFIAPGTRVMMDGGFDIVCATMTHMIRGEGAEIDFDFLDTAKFKCFTEKELKKCKSIQRRMVTDLDKPNDQLYVARLRGIRDGLVEGKYADTSKTQFDINGADASGSAVEGIIPTSPWATTDGLGMTFPYSLGTRQSIIAAPTDTRSLAVADISSKLVEDSNPGGKKFVLKLSDTASLEYDTDSDTWTIKGGTLKVECGSDPVIRKSDLDFWTSLKNHVHSANLAPPQAPITTPPGSSNVKIN